MGARFVLAAFDRQFNSSYWSIGFCSSGTSADDLVGRHFLQFHKMLIYSALEGGIDGPILMDGSQ